MNRQTIPFYPFICIVWDWCVIFNRQIVYNKLSTRFALNDNLIVMCLRFDWMCLAHEPTKAIQNSIIVMYALESLSSRKAKNSRKVLMVFRLWYFPSTARIRKIFVEFNLSSGHFKSNSPLFHGILRFKRSSFDCLRYFRIYYMPNHLECGNVKEFRSEFNRLWNIVQIEHELEQRRTTCFNQNKWRSFTEIMDLFASFDDINAMYGRIYDTIYCNRLTKLFIRKTRFVQFAVFTMTK